MYKSFFKLQSSPFGTSPDPRFLYMMPHTREALACLEYGISARKGFTVLTGEVGTGKTTLLRRLLTDPGLARTAPMIRGSGARSRTRSSRRCRPNRSR